MGIYPTLPYKVSEGPFKGIFEKNNVSVLKSPVRVRPDHTPQSHFFNQSQFKKNFFPVLFVGGSVYQGRATGAILPSIEIFIKGIYMQTMKWQNRFQQLLLGNIL